MPSVSSPNTKSNLCRCHSIFCIIIDNVVQVPLSLTGQKTGWMKMRRHQCSFRPMLTPLQQKWKPRGLARTDRLWYFSHPTHLGTIHNLHAVSHTHRTMDALLHATQKSTSMSFKFISGILVFDVYSALASDTTYATSTC